MLKKLEYTYQSVINMEINKINIDTSIINMQKDLYNIKILSVGSNQNDSFIKLFGDIILPNSFNKSLILKVILYNEKGQIVGTSKFSGIGGNEESFLTFSFEFTKFCSFHVEKVKFFFVEERRY